MGHWDGHTDADAFSVSRAEHPRSIQNAPEPCSQLPTATRRPRRKGCLVWLLPRVDTAYLPLSRLAQSWGACGLPTEWQSSGASCSTASPTPSLTHNRYPETSARASSPCPGGAHGREPDHTRTCFLSHSYSQPQFWGCRTCIPKLKRYA